MVDKIECIPVPTELPFLEAICWQLSDVKALTNLEKLDRYNRGHKYNGVLGELKGEELLFFNLLTRCGYKYVYDK